MLGRETKLGTRLAGVSGRAGASKEVEFPREVPARRSRIEKTLCLADIYHPAWKLGYGYGRESYISAITTAGLTFVFPFRLRSAAKERPTLTSFLTSPFLLRRT